MRLVLFSGGSPKENLELNELLVQQLQNASRASITLIPTCDENARSDYLEFQRHFASFNLRRPHVLMIDRKPSADDVARAMDSDVVFLGGGNTFLFLESLRRAHLMAKLQKFANEGRLLAGRSAGAIMMTPTIHLAGIPDFDRDDNPHGLKNLKALKLVNFEIFPHYRARKVYDDVFSEYSGTHRRLVYACTDGAGIVVRDNQTILVGKMRIFSRGFRL